MVEVGLAQLGGGGLDVGVRGDLGVVHQCLVGIQLLLGGGQGALRRHQGVAGVGQFFLGDGAALGQLLAAGVVGAGPFDLDAPGSHLGLVAVDVAVQATHLAHGLGQVGLGALLGDGGVAGIEFHQRLALADVVAIIHGDAGHGANDLGRDLHQVAVDVGIVGIGMEAAIEQVVAVDTHAGQDHHQQQEQQEEFAFAGALRLLLLGIVVGGCGGIGHGRALGISVWPRRRAPAAVWTVGSRHPGPASAARRYRRGRPGGWPADVRSAAVAAPRSGHRGSCRCRRHSAAWRCRRSSWRCPVPVAARRSAGPASAGG